MNYDAMHMYTFLPPYLCTYICILSLIMSLRMYRFFTGCGTYNPTCRPYIVHIYTCGMLGHVLTMAKKMYAYK